MTPEEFDADVKKAIDVNIAAGLEDQLNAINVKFTQTCEAADVHVLACAQGLISVYRQMADMISVKTQRMIAGTMAGESDEEIIAATVEPDQVDAAIAHLKELKAARGERHEEEE